MIYKIFLLILISYSTLSEVDKNEKTIEKLKDEWHVSTLKSTDFNEDICEDIAKTAKQNDAAVIEFVSSDPLPFNESDIIQNMCIHKKKENAKRDKSGRTASVDRVSNAANISKVNETTNKNETAGARRVHADRAHDYQFSSVEYYDEHPDFDESQCPDDVEVVELELDELRSYDLECEIIIEWRSLD